MAHNRTQLPIRPDVRFGSKADICGAISHVRFTPESGHRLRPQRLSAKRTSTAAIISRIGRIDQRLASENFN
jgi:hypothetical protein